MDGHLSRICVATNLMRFLPKTGRATLVVLSNLASSGVYRATFVTKGAVVSYATFPPLPTKVGGLFLLHYPESRLHQTLSGTLLYEARTFLTPKRCATVCLTYMFNKVFIMMWERTKPFPLINFCYLLRFHHREVLILLLEQYDCLPLYQHKIYSLCIRFLDPFHLVQVFYLKHQL